MDKVFELLVAKMKAFLRRANKIAAVIWTKKGMTESFLGTTARFYDSETKTMHSMTIACRSFSAPHTAVRVYKLTMEIMKSWEIPPSKVSAVSTDNGSNMVAAHKDLILRHGSFVEEVDEQEEQVIQVEQEDFSEDVDVDHEIDGHLSFEDDCEQMFAESQQSPRESSSKKPKLLLIADVSTRWNSILLSLKRLYELKDAVQDILSKHLKIPCITPGEWVTVRFIIKLLDKFKTVTDDFSAEKTATVYRVYYSVNVLVRHLESIRHALLRVDFADYGTESPFNQVILVITSELDRVLGHTINELNPNFDALYLVITFLHKTLRFTLTAKNKSIASRWLAIKNAEWCIEVEKDRDGYSTIEPQARTSDRDDKLDFFITAESETVASKSPVELEIQSYMEIPMCSTDEIDSNPEEFWISASGKFPLLSRLALDILVIPAASSAPERVFAIATLSTIGKANRLAGRHLERKVLCRRDTAHLPGIDD
ncbi:hypothetical protein RvY_00609 [Ramazzottius varieornatus]|uniref:HAT C-terminal dimerisation domain-containing protein n=1 Tax=Ramazzottius varieornatus TaxID=947166 RepID=A0A1D1UEA4_RAMVA|nr:hypothetical protein RvY_00609 [Ramazzottius varieornatus]